MLEKALYSKTSAFTDDFSFICTICIEYNLELLFNKVNCDLNVFIAK